MKIEVNLDLKEAIKNLASKLDIRKKVIDWLARLKLSVYENYTRELQSQMLVTSYATCMGVFYDVEIRLKIFPLVRFEVVSTKTGRVLAEYNPIRKKVVLNKANLLDLALKQVGFELFIKDGILYALRDTSVEKIFFRVEGIITSAMDSAIGLLGSGDIKVSVKNKGCYPAISRLLQFLVDLEK